MLFWVVGCSGILGSAFCRFLQKEKFSFLATASELDIRQKEKVLEFVQKHPQITHILNCAAYTNVDRAEEEKENAFLLNVAGVKNLALTAQMIQAKLISFSTDYVFDGLTSTPYTEESITNPLNVYGQTKREGEILLLSLLPSALIIRISWLFGLTGNHFVKKMVGLMQKNKILSIVDDQIGRPTYAEDVAKNLLAFLSLEGIYHFANSQQTSWYGFAQNIARLAPGPFICEKIVPISSELYRAKALRPKYSVLSTEKIEKIKIIPRNYTSALEEYFS